MAAETTGSTVPRRQLGRYLRELRNRQRMTVKRAAGEMEWSETKLWRVENGLTSLRSHDVEALCRIYGAPPDLTEALRALAKETKAKGWWHDYGDVIPEWLDVYFGLEEAASELSTYQPGLVPGLLQTEQYARSVIKEDKPNVDDGEIERRVHLRIARQMLVRREADPPELHVALDEAVLRRPVGGAEVLAAQLESLIYTAGLPNVTLRVVPHAAGLHSGLMTGPFVILRFPMNSNGVESEPATVYVEGYTGALYLDKPREVARYTIAFDSIWDAALDEVATTGLINQVSEELRKGSWRR